MNADSEANPVTGTSCEYGIRDMDEGCHLVPTTTRNRLLWWNVVSHWYNQMVTDYHHRVTRSAQRTHRDYPQKTARNREILMANQKNGLCGLPCDRVHHIQCQAVPGAWSIRARGIVRNGKILVESLVSRHDHKIVKYI